MKYLQTKTSWRSRGGGGTFLSACLMLLCLAADAIAPYGAALAATPASLRGVPVPEPSDLSLFISNREAAVRLGKALFWDMQVGSDGKTSCATCHFHAGTDSRTGNSVSPGLLGGDSDFTLAVNGTLTAGDFPLTRLADPHDRFSARTHTNDVVSSQGVPLTAFQPGRTGTAVEAGRALRDTVFTKNGRNVRRVEPRNTPSVINAVFNFANFWDGRANHFFNGVNPFGIQDVSARIYVSNNGTIEPLELNRLTDPVTGARVNLLDNSSLASQAVGPPLSDIEMSWRDRSFPEIGKKLLSLRPLSGQVVHRNDSVLGSLSRSPQPGLATTYAEMIREAFPARFWDSTQTVQLQKSAARKVLPSRQEPRTFLLNGGKALPKRAAAALPGTTSYTLMEANFAFFFGLAVQLYEATLVSDDTPFDRFVSGDPTALTARQQRGMNLFFSGAAGCADCHVGAELTAASITNARNALEPGLIELMAVGDGALANYDIGFYNVGVTPTGEDIGRGADDPFGFPLAFSRQNFLQPPPPFTFPKPGCVNDFIGDPPNICPPTAGEVTRVAVNGAFKTPGLRNVELTGPYFHNGSLLTLRQTVDFYVRGGNFREANIANIDPVITDINGLKGAGKEEDRAALVDFLLALTDERVRWERAPFDHPQLFVPDGHSSKVSGDPRRKRTLDDRMMEIPAVGAAGRQSQGLPPLRPFLDTTGDPQFHYRN
ncbi:cytochrome-c peroxidase [Geobacter sp. DSM 9736]|uniref:cytochrome-c peroxidase n=1 Tax=Geobacter sp. DSM 9736 TaxID=1277350 RepID=UPI000B502861|nr:cytochrome c peroxidase [Geobacter sp. DSM 9736]SNB44963.1 Di-haem cytochrome c peroxidase [Geobacter sp. DSM 9736]